MTDDHTLVRPAQVGCQDRGHPTKTHVQYGTYCLICSILYRIGGDRAVEQSRKSEQVENEWLMGRRS